MFQHTAARRRLDLFDKSLSCAFEVSTHSRPKAAGTTVSRANESLTVSTHSRPKAAGIFFNGKVYFANVSTHSRPKAAGVCLLVQADTPCCFNTQPPEGGWDTISFHSWYYWGFNTQPPEGGWVKVRHNQFCLFVFQHTAARRRLGVHTDLLCVIHWFQHTAARRRLAEPVNFYSSLM